MEFRPTISTIFHIDMDAFFAAVEKRDNPSLVGKPVIIGAQPGHRGVVSTADYEARKYGVHSAMPINEAYRRCPHGVYLRPRMSAYAEESAKIMKILHSFSPAVEQVSIDEAFVDMTGTEKLWGPAYQAARTMSQTIIDRTRLTASIGIAPNKFLAKLASDLQKPAGITHAPLSEHEIENWLAPMPVSRIWGVGRRMRQELAAYGIHTIGDLQKLKSELLEQRFGKHGLALFSLCRGRDSREVEEGGQVKSVSREHTFPQDSTNPEQWRRTLLTLASEVGRRARKRGVKGMTVVLTYRTPDFQRRSQRRTLPRPTDLSQDIFREALMLLNQIAPRVHALRLIGVGITNFTEVVQTDLFIPDQRSDPWRVSEKTMDSILARFGKSAILRAGELEDEGA
ncbi:MAG: DNA polymerase IV [Chitinivibrionales bacterium]|nr:DNA polymerase IV [Chitinivibrionales bacterium]MBD3355831.1 DNA polymerase IV [Chitinivibrionales bacterium]